MYSHMYVLYTYMYSDIYLYVMYITIHIYNPGNN